MQTRCGRDVDNVPWFAVLDTEIWSSSADNLEGRCAVKVDNGMPLLVGHLVDHAIPCVARIVHDDVDFAVSKLCRLLDELVDVVVI